MPAFVLTHARSLLLCASKMIIVWRLAPSLPCFITTSLPLLLCSRASAGPCLGASERIFITGALSLYVFMAPTGRTVHGRTGRFGNYGDGDETARAKGSERIESHESALLYGGEATPLATRVECMFTCSLLSELSHTTLNIQFGWETTYMYANDI